MNTDKPGELVIVGDFSKLLDLVRHIQSLRGIHAGYTSIRLNGTEQTTPVAEPICPYCNCSCPTYVHRNQINLMDALRPNKPKPPAPPKQNGTEQTTPVAEPICPYCNCSCPTYVHRNQHICNTHSNINQSDGRPAPPKPLQVKKQELSLVSAYVFVKHMTYHSMRQFKP